MKVLVTGASGLLGRAVMAAFQAEAACEVRGAAFRRVGQGLDRVDLRDAEAARNWVLLHRPDVLVHAAAERHPDACESDPEGTAALNVGGTRALAEACREVGAWMLFISTDYVFDGTCPPYHPNDVPNPMNAYGRSKREGEQVVLGAHPAFGILRVPILYGPTSDLTESAVTELLQNLRAAPERMHSMDAWAVRYPTFTPDVAAVVGLMARLRLSGISHWSGDEALTKADMAHQLAKADRRDSIRILPVAGSSGGALRPRDCHLDCSRLEALGDLRRTPFRDGIRQVLGDS